VSARSSSRARPELGRRDRVPGNAECTGRPLYRRRVRAGLAHLANVSYRVGRTLDFDPVTELVKGDDEANYLLRDGDRGYRPPFVVPENV
jgi:hypothetical protein